MKANSNIIKIVLVIVIIAVGGFYYYTKLLSPKIIEIRNVNVQNSAKKIELETYKAVRAAGATILTQNTFYQKWTVALNEMIPNKFENNDNIQLVLGLLQLGANTGVNFAALNILDPSVPGAVAAGSATKINGIFKNVIGINFSVDTSNFQSLQNFNNRLLNNFKNIIISETYSVEVARPTGSGTTSGGIIYKEVFTGYLLLSPDAMMPAAVKSQ
jgi:hypothetical protein